LNQYIVHIHYSETVRARARSFVHDVEVVAPNPDWARDVAMRHFNHLADYSWVGWIRTVAKVEVEHVPWGEAVQDAHALAVPRPKPGESPT
jgi:hypothetical protein